MRWSSLFFAFVGLVSSLVFQERPAQPLAVDFAHDLGVGVEGVKPLVAAIPRADLERVGARVAHAPEELAGIQLFTGTVLSRGSAARTQDLVVVPLAGAAKGGRLVFAATDGRAGELGLWGAVDFDEDPTLRWGTFIAQLRVTGTHETGAEVGAVSLAPTKAAEASSAGGEKKLSEALLRQRQVMRRNGIWLGMSRRATKPPPSEWLAELAQETADLAKLSPDLAPVLGPGGPERHAGFARDLGAIYTDMASMLRDDPDGDLGELKEQMLSLCSSCHRSTNTELGGRKWQELAGERRRALGLAETRLELGFDVAPTLGDHEGVSKEIADKVRAGLLLLEAARK